MTFSKLAFAIVTLVSSFALADAPKAPAASMPTAPDELVAAGKAMAGTWNCKGNLTGMDGKPVPMNGTYKNVVELDKFWVHGTFTAKMDPKFTFQSEEYTTYDAGTKMWKRVWVSNDGGMMWGTAKADPTKQDWEMTTEGPHGQGMIRDHVDTSDVKTGVKRKLEASVDKGKTWMQVYDMVCKK
jgi:hypothetical protein